MQEWRRYTLIACASMCGVAAVCLVAVAVFMDLAAADRLGSVLGAMAGLAGLSLSLWGLAGSGRRSISVEAHAGGVASGGHVGRVVVGDRNEVAASASAPRRAAPSADSVRASGAGSIAAAGDVDEVITGDGNQA